MEHHIRRKAVPGTPSPPSSPAITPLSQPTPQSSLQHTHTLRVSSDSDTSPRQSLISQRPSHDETNETELHPRNSLTSRGSFNEGIGRVDRYAPEQSPPEYSCLPGDAPSYQESPSQPSNSDVTPLAKDATRMLDKLGWWPATLVVLCLVLLSVSTAFLSWIWFARREDARWRNLMLGSYSTMPITITAFMVRLAVAGLTWVTVAMMASVVVERHGVPEGKMAEASMARYTGSIISLILDGFTLKTSWFRILVPLQVVCTVLSQLSSTLLFSDFKNDLLPGFPVDTSVKYDFKGSSNNTGPLMLGEALSGFAPRWNQFVPETFEPFAEHSSLEGKISGDAVDDTGPVWRALLPLGAYDNTTNINEYTGVARVYDARTICVRPDIQSFALRGANSSDGRSLSWMGTARVNASGVPDVLNADADGFFDMHFTCPFTADMIPSDRATWVQCSDTRNHRIPTLDPLFYNRSAIEALHTHWEEDVKGTNILGDISPKYRIFDTRTGQAQMLLGARYDQAKWITSTVEEVVFDGTNNVLMMAVATSAEEGPWSILDMKVEGDDNEVLSDVLADGGPVSKRPIPMRFSYCWDVMSHGNAPVPYLNITATSEMIVSPPVTSWSESAARYITDGVRRQLGATAERLLPRERAVLTLTKESLKRAIETEVKPANISAFVKGINTESDDEHAYRTYLAKTPAWMAGGSLDYSPGSGTQVFWETLLEDVIEDTGSPALAVQAINTAASQMIYSHWMGSFTAGAQADITYFTEFRVPVKVAGYATVMAVIATQVAQLVIVGVMFRACSGSVLNDAWLVVSQVSSSPEAMGALVRERSVADAEVRRSGGGKGGLRRMVVVRDGAFRGSDGV